MHKIMFLVVLSVIAAGRLKADPICVANTLAFYEANITSASTACSIGGLDFSLFNGSNAGITHSGPNSGLNTSEIELTPVAGGFHDNPDRHLPGYRDRGRGFGASFRSHVR